MGNNRQELGRGAIEHVRDVWHFLEADEEESYWQFASVYVSKMDKRDDFRDDLSYAIGELEAGHTAPRTVSGLRPVHRALSNDDLRRKILRHRHRLFPFDYAGGDWGRLFSYWVRMEKKNALLKVLDALGCAHDEDGRRVGDVPTHKPKQAASELQKVASEVNARNLLLVLQGLIFNDTDWAYLREVVSLLNLDRCDVPTAETGTITSSTEALVAQPAGPRDGEPPIIISDAVIGELRSQIQALIVDLQAAIDVLREERVPDDPGISAALEKLRAQFRQLAGQLQPVEESVAGLEARLKARLSADEGIRLLEKFKSLIHVSDPAFLGLARIVTRSNDAAQRLSSDEKGEIDAGVLAPFRALEKLVEYGESVDDEEAMTLDGIVRAYFGVDVALAASRRRLRFGSIAPETAQSEEADAGKEGRAEPRPAEVRPATPVPSEMTGPESKKAENALEVTDSKPATAAVPEVTGTGPTEVQKTLEVKEEAKAQTGPLRERVPGNLIKFAAYRRDYWNTANGVVALAPWIQEDFASRLTSAMKAALSTRQLGEAYLYVAALDRLGKPTSLAAVDLACSEGILDAPESANVGVSDSRPARIKAVLGGEGNDPSFRLALFLEALRPSSDDSFRVLDVDSALRAAEYHDEGLEAVVAFLLRMQSAGMDPIETLRVNLGTEGIDDLTKLRADLAAKRKVFRVEVAGLWSAAGGKIERTHCRQAWKRFMEEEIRPFMDHFAPSRQDQSEVLKWDMDSLRNRQRRLPKNYIRIVDGAGVGMTDRKSADKAAGALMGIIAEIIDLAHRILVGIQRERHSATALPLDEARRLLGDHPLPEAAEEICRILFTKCVRRAKSRNALRLEPRVLLKYPYLLTLLPAEVLDSADLATNGISVGALDDPICAAARLLEGGSRIIDAPGEAQEFGNVLRQTVVDLKRTELIACLTSTKILDSQEKNRVHRESSELGDEIFIASQQLDETWRDCEELLAPIASALSEPLREARELAYDHTPTQPYHLNLMLKAWIQALEAVAREARAEAIGTYKELAKERPPEVRTAIGAALEQGQYHQVHLLLNQGTIGKTLTPEGVERRTEWRTAAVKRFDRPVQTLREQFVKANPEVKDLVEMWAKKPSDAAEKGQLHKLFYEFISGQSGVRRGRRQRVFPANLRDFRGARVIINCALIRELFRRERSNPTFVPQLADFETIVLISPPPLGNKTAGIATDWGKSVAAENANSLVVFIAPGLPDARRNEILSNFRQRALNAALIDDVDLCRLAAVDTAVGQDLVPFLEIVLEQLDLERASPFSSQDGQHVRLETYVGRQQQADALALTAAYTRVFSGRKLGKSAMLKYVAATYDKAALPSGNNLNVLFITIAGGDTEAWICEQIISEMSHRFRVTEKSAGAGASAGDRLSDYITRFLAVNPKESLLIILDEADAFIEGQLRDYDVNREGSLSFKMMKELPAKVDANGLPRVRVVFSGYRVTNTREGVWANAGDVLRLVPLQEEEAVRFVRGSLARVGVDIGSHAPFVARRCGFQPAVLIRFGDCLLKRLKRSRVSAQREVIEVKQDDVVMTFNDPAVMDEIRTIVNNNFQGNRVGAVVFGAMLLALKDLAPGYTLRDGPAEVLAKIKEIDPDTGWLEEIDPSATSEIERNLQDFIERELVLSSDERRFGARDYRLRFPHYLPVLTQQSDLAQQVRQQIQILRQSPHTRRHVGSILSESALDTLRYWHRSQSSEYCKLIVVAGHWLAAIDSDKGGVADRLGLSTQAVINGQDRQAYDRSLTSGARAYRRVSLMQCGELVRREQKAPVLVTGGIEVLRWGVIQDANGSGGPIELLGLRQVTEARASWWFEASRALHFENPDAVVRMHGATGGMPFLLSKMDSLLKQGPGQEVTAAQLRGALSVFEGSFKDYAKELVQGPETERLLPREQELLRMIVKVALAGIPEFALGKEFEEYWAMCQEAQDQVLPPYATPEDEACLRLLALAGLVDVNDEKRLSVKEDGPLARLVKVWGQ